MNFFNYICFPCKFLISNNVANFSCNRFHPLWYSCSKLGVVVLISLSLLEIFNGKQLVFLFFLHLGPIFTPLTSPVHLFWGRCQRYLLVSVKTISILLPCPPCFLVDFSLLVFVLPIWNLSLMFEDTETFINRFYLWSILNYRDYLHGKKTLYI